MEKILTISIAAYNVEKYIRQTLDSIVDEEVIDDLEVFVIDDGGTDHTLDVANKYAAQYPNSIFPVHKENGGYGSTVNYSIAHASGKYFKLLDGDDWFDAEGLMKLTEYLKTVSVDMVVTPTCIYRNEDVPDRMDTDWIKKNIIIPTRSLKNVSPIPMWSVTFRTDVIRREWVDLPSKVLYTDIFYLLQGIYHSNEMICKEATVYCYREDRPGNSTNKMSRVNHYHEAMDVAILCAKYCADRVQGNEYPLMNAIAAYHYSGGTRGLLIASASTEMRDELISYDKKLKEISPTLYKETEKYHRIGKTLKFIRRTRYVGYWPAHLLLQMFWHKPRRF